MEKKADYKRVTECNVCGRDSLDTVFKTKGMPLTGLYLPKEEQKKIAVYDQALNYCGNCGHGQLENVIKAEILYDNTYTHRSSASAISSAGNDYFNDYLRKLIGGNVYDLVLEIGCNDLYLINKIQDIGNLVVGIDPVWKGNDHQYNKKTRILGRFIEELQLDKDLEKRPNLILSSHTFEHVGALFDQLEMLVSLADEGCLFVIEMPSFDTMVKIRRYDQVFHQHIQYLSLSSMIYMINRLKCKYLNHTYNYNYWGGTLLFSFQKKSANDISDNPRQESIGVDIVRQGFEEFSGNLRKLRDHMMRLNDVCYGFGAAQMLPILAHHMESDLGFMEAILDDNDDRIGKYLPGVDCPIIAPGQVQNISDSAVMVTALDSMRPILQRLMEISPRKIISPANIF